MENEQIYDVDGKVYTLNEAIVAIPRNTSYCYTSLGIDKEKGCLKTKLCPFLDWLKRDDIKDFYDFQMTGYCHFLKEGDFFDDETGKEEDIIHLERFSKHPIKMNTKQRGTDLLWDSCKECGINEFEEEIWDEE